jgi:hypothetical protein
MRKLLITSAALAALTVVPLMAHAQTVVIEPEVDTWVMEQPDGAVVTMDGDIVVGTPVPDTVELIEVPSHTQYRYAYVNKRRVLVESKTRKVVKVY